MGLANNWTPLVRNVLVTLFAIYLVQLLAAPRVDLWFGWQPYGSGLFYPWQPLTCVFLGTMDPLSTCLQWLGVFFLLPILEQVIPAARIGRGMLFSWALAVCAIFLLEFPGILTQTGEISGLTPLLAALTGLVGFLLPNATFLLFFVLPVKALWIAWGTGLLTFLYTVASRDAASAASFFAWAGAWIFVQFIGGNFRRWRLQIKKKQVERKLSRFEVIEGGKQPNVRTKQPDEWIN